MEWEGCTFTVSDESTGFTMSSTRKNLGHGQKTQYLRAINPCVCIKATLAPVITKCRVKHPTTCYNPNKSGSRTPQMATL